jgi:hypothetical protein
MFDALKLAEEMREVCEHFGGDIMMLGVVYVQCPKGSKTPETDTRVGSFFVDQCKTPPEELDRVGSKMNQVFRDWLLEDVTGETNGNRPDRKPT